MHMLRYLLTVHLRPAYRVAGWAAVAFAAIGAGCVAVGWGAGFLIVAEVVGWAIAAFLLWAASAVLNARIARAMGRTFTGFEAAYDAWRRAGGIDDPFYHELDREEAAAAAASKPT